METDARFDKDLEKLNNNFKAGRMSTCEYDYQRRWLEKYLEERNKIKMEVKHCQ